MDDEATLLPRKLQAALEQSLEQRNDIINQDSDSESDEGEKPDVVALPICLQWTHYLCIMKHALTVKHNIWLDCISFPIQSQSCLSTMKIIQTEFHIFCLCLIKYK